MSLRDAIAGLTRALQKLAPEDHYLVLPALELLSERLPAQRKRQLEQLATLEQRLAHLDAGDRADRVQDVMGLSRATYFRLRPLLVGLKKNETET